MGTTPTRLEVLKDARKLAATIGIVQDADNYFERRNGEVRPVSAHEFRTGQVKPEQVCGVCIAGACALADILAGGEGDATEWCTDAEVAARDVLGDESDYYDYAELTEALAVKGTPYLLAVLDRMVELEAAKVPA